MACILYVDFCFLKRERKHTFLLINLYRFHTVHCFKWLICSILISKVRQTMRVYTWLLCHRAHSNMEER